MAGMQVGFCRPVLAAPCYISGNLDCAVGVDIGRQNRTLNASNISFCCFSDYQESLSRG